MGLLGHSRVCRSIGHHFPCRRLQGVKKKKSLSRTSDSMRRSGYRRSRNVSGKSAPVFESQVSSPLGSEGGRPQEGQAAAAAAAAILWTRLPLNWDAACWVFCIRCGPSVTLVFVLSLGLRGRRGGVCRNNLECTKKGSVRVQSKFFFLGGGGGGFSFLTLSATSRVWPQLKHEAP